MMPAVSGMIQNFTDAVPLFISCRNASDKADKMTYALQVSSG